MTDDAKKQEDSLVYYQNTYLQNSGVLYESTDPFDIKASYDGKVTNVVLSGDVIGKSGTNKLNNDSKNSLLFEVYHNGVAIDPEDFYNMNIDDLK